MAIMSITYAIIFFMSGSLAAVIMKKDSGRSQWIIISLFLAGSACGLFASINTLYLRNSIYIFFLWQAAGSSLVGIDSLSAFFLMPLFLVSGLGSLYSAGYYPAKKHPRNAAKILVFWGILTSSVVLIIISRSALSFLLGWELMAISAFLLVGAEDEKPECRKSSLIYLLASHASALMLFAFFLIRYKFTGTFDFVSAPGSMPKYVQHILYLLAFTAFGLKAGIMPFHFWLPDAHANAPTQVSALMSGVLLKVGIYGLVRMLVSLLPYPPVLWGIIFLAAGAFSSITGVVFAIAQHDLKKLLAYHSIENIGIIFLGLGSAMLGRALNNQVLFTLGLAGCLLHVLNHSLFKSLLFFGAGAVINAFKTRQIDSMGGAARFMPLCAIFFFIGSIAISGLPPFNGFISELLIYLGLLQQGSSAAGSGSLIIFIPALALTGALASACFVKVCGTVFSGRERLPAAIKLEAPVSMLVSMALLALLCTAIGILPVFFFPALESAGAINLAAWKHIFIIISLFSSCLLLFVLCVLFTTARTMKKIPKTATWSCGYAEVNSRIQYSASSFAAIISGFFHFILKTSPGKERTASLFPVHVKFHSHVNEIVLDRILFPFMRCLSRWFTFFNRFQQGNTQQYIFYIIFTAAVLLFIQVPFGKWIMTLLTLK